MMGVLYNDEGECTFCGRPSIEAICESCCTERWTLPCDDEAHDWIEIKNDAGQVIGAKCSHCPETTGVVVALEAPQRDLRCVQCGGEMEDVLKRVGSLRCHDCRDAGRVAA